MTLGRHRTIGRFSEDRREGKIYSYHKTLIVYKKTKKLIRVMESGSMRGYSRIVAMLCRSFLCGAIQSPQLPRYTHRVSGERGSAGKAPDFKFQYGRHYYCTTCSSHYCLYSSLFNIMASDYHPTSFSISSLSHHRSGLLRSSRLGNQYPGRGIPVLFACHMS